MHNIAHAMGVEESLPGVRLELFHSQRETPLLRLYKGAIVSHAQYPASYARANRIPLSGIQPGIRSELLEAERDTQFVTVKLQYCDLNLVAYMPEVARVRQAPP